ncbi:transcriptional regulator [Parvibaculum lavamentivorans DS-1]|uniref:Transcriptional regulator n=1 Tax=Parvibaculum lavamentivorans (strain DS-1 / DSM 13023 / NCIMB 13966) TaxID=402881 RepID=A7HQS6_PARL1|nr:XRE family transcriptional regulator [Parvibaculum lavamentivorans]ABS62259.1 transcriptional regulator [Parvibaculum lavamentivorans DS-1]
MGKSLKEMMEKLPADRREAVEARAASLIAEEMSLRDLRKAMQQTQSSIARKLDIGQEGVSRIEQRADLLLSTARSYVEALGGELELVARFPGRGEVVISHVSELTDKPARPPKRQRSPAPRKKKVSA